MDLVSRVKELLTDPTVAWKTIESEPSETGALLKNYVAILAAIPAVCGFIGASIIGVRSQRTGLVVGLVSAIGSYILTFVGVFVTAIVIDALADKFGGRKNFNNAFKIATYAPTAACVAALFLAIPILSVLSVLGLYTFYLIYTGLPILMKVPEEKSLGYFLTVLVCGIIVVVLIMFMPAMLTGERLF